MKTIIASSSELLCRKRNIKDIVLSFLMVAAAAAMFFAGETIADKNSSIYLLLVTVAAVLLLIAVVRFLKSNKFVYKPTGSPLKEHSLFFSPGDLREVTESLSRGDTSALKALYRGQQHGIRLDIVHSKDHKFAAGQVFEYIPHTYEPVSEVFRIEAARAADFCKLVNEIGK